MPNHIHGIIIIDHPVVQTPDPGVSNSNTIINSQFNGMPNSGVTNGINDMRTIETPKLGVSTDNRGRTMNASEKWKSATIGVIVNQYKRIVSILARKINARFEWQSRFYDHIIRNDESFQRIANYILNNPANWNNDKFFNRIP